MRHTSFWTIAGIGLKTNKTRRRITSEALDSGTPDVAHVGNPGVVWRTWFHCGETPQHGWLILSRRALFIFTFLLSLFGVKAFFFIVSPRA